MNIDDLLHKVNVLCILYPLDFELTTIGHQGWRAIFFELVVPDVNQPDHDHVPYSAEHQDVATAIEQAIDKYESGFPDRPVRFDSDPQ